MLAKNFSCNVLDGLKQLKQNLRLLTSEAMGAMSKSGNLDPKKLKAYEIFEEAYPGLGGVLRLLEKSNMFKIKNMPETLNSLTIIKHADDAKRGAQLTSSSSYKAMGDVTGKPLGFQMWVR